MISNVTAACSMFGMRLVGSQSAFVSELTGHACERARAGDCRRLLSAGQCTPKLTSAASHAQTSVLLPYLVTGTQRCTTWRATASGSSRTCAQRQRAANDSQLGCAKYPSWAQGVGVRADYAATAFAMQPYASAMLHNAFLVLLHSRCTDRTYLWRAAGSIAQS